MAEGHAEGSEELSPSPALSTITLEEWRGSASTKLSKTATLTADISSFTVIRTGSRWSEIRGKILEAFVPEGFPTSVTPDYVPFQIWDSLQGLSTYIRSMLSTQALLSAIGVGEKSATVIGATFQGSNLDSNAKMWRLIADFMNDLGMVMDLISPLFPSALVLIVCLGSVSRSFTSVASGATRAALTHHFSLEHNAADISAKEGSQETMATMIGMAIGMLLAHLTRGCPLAVWVSFLFLTFFHMYANYKAVSCLSLTTLNSERTSLLLQNFLKNGQVLSPQQVSRMEHVIPSLINPWRSSNEISLHRHVLLGFKVSCLNLHDMVELSGSINSHYKTVKYLLLERKGAVQAIIHKQATPPDILQSFIHALVITSLTEQSKDVHTESCLWMDENYNGFIVKLRTAGWEAERLLTPSIAWRAEWDLSSSLFNKKIN